MAKNKLTILKKPLSLRALKARATVNPKKRKNYCHKDGWISVNIVVGLDDLIGKDIDELNDLADERILDLNTIVGSLSNISYKVVGHVCDTKRGGYLMGSVILNVTADVSDIIQEK
jgi:hypothetical protein